MTCKMLFALTLLVSVIFVAGCGNNSSTTETPGSGSSATEVKTMDEYRAEADKAITTENAEAELKKLESEISTDK